MTSYLFQIHRYLKIGDYLMSFLIKRIDKRGVYDVRDVDVTFMPTRGSCIASLGNTK